MEKDTTEHQGLVYECLKCGKRSPAEGINGWERVNRTFKCPHCGYRCGKKIRPPFVKRVNAI